MDSPTPLGFRDELLKQDDSLSSSNYKKYRMKLEESLDRAERNERIAGRIVVTGIVVSFVLMFVGGNQVVGSFDPWDDTATVLSVTLGVAFCVASVVAWIGLASYYSRFRPQTRAVKDNLRDARILELEHQIQLLRNEIKQVTKRQ